MPGKRISLTILMMSGLVATGAMAQEEDQDAAESYLYATYMKCSLNGQDRVDELVAKHQDPIYAQAVKDGEITSAFWIGHHTGGKWRRIRAFSAPSLGALLDAQDAIGDRIDATSKKAQQEIGAICSSHDDYIWKAEAGSSGENPGPASFSVYYVCNESKEERADEIMKKDFAPIFDRYVAEGKLGSWGWLSHWVGGKYRRLQIMSGPDHKSLLNTRNELLEEIYGEDSKAGEEFTEICGSHADYMWDIKSAAP